jgi:uncharacterized protein YyaL (SSP411 family)
MLSYYILGESDKMTNAADRVSNRLIHEKSPYLLQHAHNPVDWYPWGEEAFTKAKTEDKPIFLSIGYSTCHWCHVMERESFEDEEVAALLNGHFVAIKVDREERPDIDNIYMAACQAMTGQGGWPLTILMTPDKKPFFAGTYFPKRSMWGRTGLIEILQKTVRLWEKDKDSLLVVGQKLVTSLKKPRLKETEADELDENLSNLVFEELLNRYDSVHGGFDSAPKFPTPHNLIFLLRYWKKTGQEKALKMAEDTLRFMARGGIFDQIGYGFHRYSTDKIWLVPHFEKMLYDNALIAYTYLEAYEATGKNEYAEIAKKVFTYVKRSMTSPEGGFYSAEDADSEGVEGKFYVWSPEEIISILGTEKGKIFCEVYGITDKGNFEGKNIPNTIYTSPEEALAKSGVKNGDFMTIIEDSINMLYREREKRTHPHKDDKILTSWNGLMIAALAKGARLLKDDDLKNMAKRAVDFILKKLVREDGRLFARYRQGESAFLGYVDDYAFLIWGLLELYKSDFDVFILKKAYELCSNMIELFWDEENRGFFFSGKDSEQLIYRPKEVYDGAVPSGNSVNAYCLLWISRIFADKNLEERAKAVFESFSTEVSRLPSAHTFFAIAHMFAHEPSRDIAIVGRPGSEDTKAMLDKVNSFYMPYSVIIFVSEEPGRDEIRGMLPFTKDMHTVGGKAAAYVCENYTCQAPITDIEKLFNKCLD